MKKILFLALFVISMLAPTKRTLDDLSCGQYDELRKDCGYGGIRNVNKKIVVGMNRVDKVLLGVSMV